MFNGYNAATTSIELSTKSVVEFASDTTVFFTAYIVGKGQSFNAAYEVKGCRRNNQIIDGVVNTYMNTSINVLDPIVSFNLNNTISIKCHNQTTEPIEWAAVIDCVTI